MNAAVEVVVGLEVHVQLRTRSKLFCACAVQFAAPPNSLTCPVCAGMPGALPVLNRRAVELAVRAGLGLQCAIATWTRWDRKHYFYPDLPKGYQISQLDHPLCRGGFLDVPPSADEGPGRRIHFVRAHLEEDAGKSLHGQEHDGRGVSYIDLNRAGTPLLEIVTAPELRSGEETRRFLTELRQVLLMLAVSDGNMQEGSLRVDANVNLHVANGEQILETPIAEVKNLNSFRGVQRAIDYEAERQWALWQSTAETRKPGNKQTRGWDDERGTSYPLRDKEELDDYRYFPDPDLPRLVVDPAWVEAIRQSLPPLPASLRQQMVETHGLSQYHAEVLVAQGAATIDYLVRAVEAGGKPQQVANWLTGDILAFLNERQLSIESYPVVADSLGHLLAAIDRGQLTLAQGRDRLREVHAGTLPPADLLNFPRPPAVEMADIDRACRGVIAEQAQSVAAFRSGKEAALGPLVGILRQQFPAIEPRTLRARLVAMIQAMVG